MTRSKFAHTSREQCRANLKGHLKPPSVNQPPVLEAFRRVDTPMLFREIVAELPDMERRVITQTLDRLLKKGALSRYQIPIETECGTRMMWFYSLAEAEPA